MLLTFSAIPSAGIEPTLRAPEARVLSVERRGGYVPDMAIITDST